MSFSSSSSPLSCSPNVTPLIDVLLVLLIIFMVVVPVVPHGVQSLDPRPIACANHRTRAFTAAVGGTSFQTRSCRHLPSKR